MVTHPELDILECEVKWALQSIAANKASGGDGIPAELFKILNKVKVAQSCPNLCNPWTIRSMEFSRPGYWSGYPFASPGDLPNPGIKLGSSVL